MFASLKYTFRVNLLINLHMIYIEDDKEEVGFVLKYGATNRRWREELSHLTPPTQGHYHQSKDIELQYDFNTYPQIVTVELIVPESFSSSGLIVKGGSNKKKRCVRYVFEFDANAAIMSGGQGLRPHKVLREDEHRHTGDALFDKFRESGALLLRMEEVMQSKREKTFSLDVRVDSQRFGKS